MRTNATSSGPHTAADATSIRPHTLAASSYASSIHWLVACSRGIVPVARQPVSPAAH